MEQITIEVIIRHITDIPIRGGLTMTNIPRISTEDVPATHLFLRHNPHPLSPTTAGVEGEGGRWTDSRPHNPPLPAPRPSPPQMKIPHPCHRVPVLSSSQTDSRLSTPGWRKVRETTQVIYNYNLGPNYSVCFLFIFGRLFFLFRVQCVKRLMSDLHSVFLVVGAPVNTDGIMLLIIYSLWLRNIRSVWFGELISGQYRVKGLCYRFYLFFS